MISAARLHFTQTLRVNLRRSAAIIALALPSARAVTVQSLYYLTQQGDSRWPKPGISLRRSGRAVGF